MNKLKLVLSLAERNDVTKAVAEKFLGSLVETITAEIKNDEKVVVTGLGSFEKVERKARIGINPKTQEKIKIPAKQSLKFKPAKMLKDAIQ